MSQEKIRKVQLNIHQQVNKKYPDHINVPVPTELSKKYVSVYTIWEDILFCEYCVRNLLKLKEEKKNNTMYDFTLWYSLISIYGRCFTQPADSSKSKLEASDCFSASDTELLKLHNHLMEIRHRMLAHRGDTVWEQGLLFLQLPKNKETHDIKFHVESVRAASPPIEQLKEYAELFKHLMLVIHKKLQKVGAKIEVKMVENFYKMTAE